MIRIRVERDEEGAIRSVRVKGHAGFAPAGQDIVCAAVSVMFSGIAQGLIECASIDAHYHEAEGDSSLCLPESMDELQTHDAALLLRTLYETLQGIVQDYPSFLTIEDRRC